MKTRLAYKFLLYAIFTAVTQAVDIESLRNATIAKYLSRDFEDNIDNMAEGSNYPSDGSLLGAYQQYVNSFGGGPYAPYPVIAGYPPPPINYGPPVPVPVPVPVQPAYPGPYAVQSAYQGYFVTTTPASTTTTTTTTTTAATTTTANTPILNFLSALNPITFFTTTLPNFMMSNLFRILATIVSALGMVIFGGSLGDVLCNISPLCDMTLDLISIMTSRSVGRQDLSTEHLMQVEEFTRNAIRKYRDLQKIYQPREN